MKRLSSPLTGLFLIILVNLTLSGCMVGPEYERPDVDVPEQYKYGDADPEAAAEILTENWWELFNDERLSDLIRQAVAGNFNLMAAYERVQQARAIARQQAAPLLPFFSLDPSVTRGESSDSLGVNSSATTTYRFPFNVAYELDLFGRIRRGYQAAVRNAQAAEADWNAIRLIVETEIARNYYQLRSIDDEIEIVSKTIQLREEQLKILNSRFEFGIISQLPVAQAQAELNSNRSLLYALQRNRALLQNAIAVLMGMAPAEVTIYAAPLTDNPPAVPPVLPSALLLTRPDIRRAERFMASENARIGVATAEFFPQVNISADAGYASNHINVLFDSRSFTWGIGPNIRIPLFEGGRLRANLQESRSRYAEAYANYRQQIVEAFGEVEDALVSVDLLEQQADANQLAIDAARRAFDLSREQFKGGLVNYLSVIDTERTLLETRRLGSQLRGQRYVSAVNLVKAIGGSW